MTYDCVNRLGLLPNVARSVFASNTGHAGYKECGQRPAQQNLASRGTLAETSRDLLGWDQASRILSSEIHHLERVFD